MAFGSIAKALSKSTDDIVARLKGPKSTPESAEIPQYRGSPHEYDPDFESPYLGRQGTFASSERDQTLLFGLSSRGQGPAYFHEFPSLKDHEVFDVTRPETMSEVKALLASPQGKEYIRAQQGTARPKTEEQILQAVSTGEWTYIEDLAKFGVFDDLPDNYKAIRLRGEGDNYAYVGRRVPPKEEVKTVTLPARKHYFDSLGKTHDFISKWTKEDPTDPNVLKAFDKAKVDFVDDLRKGISEEPFALQDNLITVASDISKRDLQGLASVRYNYLLNSAYSEDLGERATKEILTSVDTKEEARSLIQELVIKRARPDEDISTAKHALRTLDSTPDENFNMWQFIRDNKFYGVILPALGLAGMADDLEIEDSLKGS